MLCIVVNSDFENRVNALVPGSIRLGGRLIDNGLHAGGLFVNAAIINSSPEWSGAFRAFATGGTALSEQGEIIIEEGRTIQFTDPADGQNFEFEILNLNPDEIFAQINL